jgi:type IV pilus assembly protein PilY1
VADAALGPPACAAGTHAVTPSGNRINDTLRAGLASTGDFYSANSPGSLRASLAAVFEDLSSVDSAGTGVGISNSTIVAGELLVQSGFATNTWEGTVAAFDAKAQIDFLNGVGAAPAAVWTNKFPAPALRNIVTSTAQNTAAAFDWCSISAAQRTDIDAVYAANSCPVAAPAIMDYLRGDTTLERRFTGGIFRDRRGATILGDVVNSSPLHSKAADHAYHLAPAASYSSSGTQGYTEYRGPLKYLAYKNTTRWATVSFGANDGMFHMLDARTGQASSGYEIFAYVPRAVYPRLRDLASPAYTHKYTVDGPVIEGDVWNGTAWKTIIVGTTGAGPAGIFAIDVTAPQSGITAANVLWDITPADHPAIDVQNHLGSTIGAGVIGSVRYDADATPATKPNGKWAFVVGNGYESVNHRAALLGLGAITPVYDGNRNIIAVYAGDKLGNLWKFDLSSDNPANWKIFNEFPVGTPQPLFAAGTNRPIMQAPRIIPHPISGLYVTFGTGKYFETTDPADTADQGIFGIWDKGQVAPVPFAGVQLLTLQEFVNSGETFRRIENLPSFDWTDDGFWIRLRPTAAAPNGERVIAPMLVDAGMLVVTSFAPESGTDRCVPGGTSYLYRLDLSGGFGRGAFGALGGETIGRKVSPGVFGGMSPVFEAVSPGATVNHSMTAADVTTMMSSPKYRVSGTGQAIEQGATGTCTHVGLHVNGTWARIPTNCAGMLPLRAWRPLR